MTTTQASVAYGTGHAGLLRRRHTTPFGHAVDRMAPLVFPHVPVEALLGFTAISFAPNSDPDGPSGITEDTAFLRADGTPANGFHEIGPFQTEAGMARGANASRTAPHPDPFSAYNNWGLLALDPSHPRLADRADHAAVRPYAQQVRTLLGHAPTMVPDGWKTAPNDQAAVGLVSLKRHRDGVIRGLDPSIRPASLSSPYAMALTFSGFSAGEGTADRVFNRYKATMAQAPDDAGKLQAFLRALSAETATRPTGGAWSKAEHGNPAYTTMRFLQKLASGRAIATGSAQAWFPPPMDPALEAPIAEAAHAHPGLLGGTGGTGGGGITGALVFVLSVAAGVGVHHWLERG